MGGGGSVFNAPRLLYNAAAYNSAGLLLMLFASVTLFVDAGTGDLWAERDK